VEALLAWVAEIPLGVVYLLTFLTAVAEGLLPVVPGDVVAALLAFIAPVCPGQVQFGRQAAP